MKKVLSILLIFAVVFAFASCAKKIGSDEETESKAIVTEETLYENANGITVLNYTAEVKKGMDGLFVTVGKAKTEFTLSFDKDKTPVKAQISNENGIVSWTFSVDSLKAGKHKVVIRETGTDNKIETEITVQD